ncbi:type IV pilus assembly protein FimV [Abyssibacter profundi]|uniref:LysM domain-containing protein n=1 Tax=Abyssibacter profundi TaxID=2182787 RepID=A0A363UJD6_9GAMM|nr:hypothetical protein [Abyssibacter profundi]PWN55539.1 hypothetical protein DEH80_12170 [Abyssibacter profundi]
MQQPRHRLSPPSWRPRGMAWGSAALLCTSLPAGALSIGEPHSVSHLAEPLSFSVDIERAGANVQDIYVRPVSTAERPPGQTELTMRVDPLPGDRLRLTVTGSKPHLEPILSFEIEVRSGSQRIAKEIAVLADVQPQASLFRQHPLVERAGETTLHLRLPGDPASAASPPPRAEREPAAPVALAATQFGPVAAGDTVSMIAQRTRPSPAMPLRQAIQAVLDANPDLRGDPAQLRAGQMLSLPAGFRSAPPANPPTQVDARQAPAPSPRGMATTMQPVIDINRFQLSEQLNPRFLAAVQPAATRGTRLTIDLSQLARATLTEAAPTSIEAEEIAEPDTAAPPVVGSAPAIDEVAAPAATQPAVATRPGASEVAEQRSWPDWLFYALINGLCAAVALGLLMRPRRVRDDALEPRGPTESTRVATSTRDLDAANEEPPELAADVIARRARKAAIDDRKLLGADDQAARPIRRRIMKLRSRAGSADQVEVARLLYLAEAYLETEQYDLSERLVRQAEGKSEGRQHRPGAAA